MIYCLMCIVDMFVHIYWGLRESGVDSSSSRAEQAWIVCLGGGDGLVLIDYLGKYVESQARAVLCEVYVIKTERRISLSF